MVRLLHYDYTAAFGIAVVETESGDVVNIIMRKNTMKVINISTINPQSFSDSNILVQYARWRHYLQVFRQVPLGRTELCTICLRNTKTVAVTMACRHVFHRNCIVEWFKQKNECPLCRKELFKERIASTCLCFANPFENCKMYE